MKITKEQVLDLVNDLNKNFDAKYLMIRNQDKLEFKIIMKDSVFRKQIANISDYGVAVCDPSEHKIRLFIQHWINSIKDDTYDIHAGSRCTPWDYLPDYMKQESLDAINGNRKVNANDPLLNVADKLNDLLDTKYGKNHAVEIANALVNINNSLKD